MLWNYAWRDSSLTLPGQWNPARENIRSVNNVALTRMLRMGTKVRHCFSCVALGQLSVPLHFPFSVSYLCLD